MVIDVLQKAYAKQKEYQQWNAKAEAAKLSYESWNNLAIQREKECKELDVKKSDLAIEFEAVKAGYRNEISFLENSLSASKSELISFETATKEKKSNLLSEVATLALETDSLAKNLAILDEDQNSILAENEILISDNSFLRTQNKQLGDFIAGQEEAIRANYSTLQSALTTIDAARERQKELEIYERRIQRYYDEAGLTIKI